MFRFISQYMPTIHRLSFYCFVFLLPWQTIWIIREVFYGEEKWQYGTIGIYGADIFLIIWICMSIYLYFDRIILFFEQNMRLIVAAALVVVWGFLSTLWASDQAVALYGALVLSFACDLFILVQIVPLRIYPTLMIFVSSSCIHACIGLWQFLSQSSFESTLLGISSHIVEWGGTATVSSDAERWLRAYGALPHPNILGAVLLMALIIAFYLSLTTKSKGHRLFMLLNIGILSLGIIVTFSRTIWVATCMILSLLFFMLLRKKWDIKKLINPLIVIIGTVSMAAVLLFPLLFERTIQDTRPSHNSVSDRGTYLQHAYDLLSNQPLIGTGIRNYTNTVFLMYEKDMPIWYIQPVHNIYILAFAELGLIGVLFLLFFFLQVIIAMIHMRPHVTLQHHLFFAIVGAIAIIGLTDHWPWSSHFGIFVTLFFSGLLLRKESGSIDHITDRSLTASEQ